jgi:hypothetical protein
MAEILGDSPAPHVFLPNFTPLIKAKSCHHINECGMEGGGSRDKAAKGRAAKNYGSLFHWPAVRINRRTVEEMIVPEEGRVAASMGKRPPKSEGLNPSTFSTGGVRLI